MAEEKTTYTVPELDFWDPNWNPDKAGKLDLTYYPEDLGIYVSLKVKPSRRQFIANLDKGVQINWTTLSEYGEVNILGGKKYGNHSVLTDFYEDISLNSTKIYDGGDKVALGIRSINIQYNSMFLPEVNIEFVDVRGMSIMSPSQAFKDEKTGSKSFFSALFTFPHPMFVLTIKGVYGNPVVYELHVLDNRTTIDTATGSVIISSKFLGYSFARLSDIPFPWVACLPNILYGQGEGREIWSEISRKGLNGKYKDTPIPTIYEFYRKTYGAISAAEKTKENSDIGKKNSNLKSLREDILQVQNYVKEISDFFCTELSVRAEFNSITIDEKRSNEISTAYSKDKYAQLSSVFPTKVEETNKKCVELGKQGITSFDIKKPFSLKEGKWVFSYDSLLAQCASLIESVNSDIESFKQKLLEEQRNTVITTLGFIPTIGNVIRILFAHYEMFHRIFFLLRDNIGSRKFNNFMNISLSGTDIFSKTDSTNTELPAWFGLRTPKEAGEISIWPNSQYARDNYFKPGQTDNIEEVKFVKAFAQCLRDFQKGMDEPPLPPGGNVILNPENIWYPINPFDISNEIIGVCSHRINPYKELLKKLEVEGAITYNKLVEMGKEIGVRMFYGISTRIYSKDVSGEGNGDNIVATAEAENFYDAIKDDTDLIDRLKEYISRDNLFVNGILYLWNSELNNEENRKSTGFVSSNEFPINFGSTDISVNLCRSGREAEGIAGTEGNTQEFESFFYDYCLGRRSFMIPGHISDYLPMKSITLKELSPLISSAYGIDFGEQKILNIPTNKNMVYNQDTTMKSMISVSEYVDKIETLKNSLTKYNFLTDTWYVERTAYGSFFYGLMMSIKNDPPNPDGFNKSFSFPNEKNVNISLRHNTIKFTNTKNDNVISKSFRLYHSSTANDLPKLSDVIANYKYGDDMPYTLQSNVYTVIVNGTRVSMTLYGDSRYYEVKKDILGEAEYVQGVTPNIMIAIYKAFLLVSTFGIVKETVLDYINKCIGLNNGIIRLPKCIVLYLGACAWVNVKEVKDFLTRFLNTELYDDTIDLFAEIDYQVYIMSFFRRYFIQWATVDAPKIIDKLELKYLDSEIGSKEAFLLLFKDKSSLTLTDFLNIFSSDKNNILETYWGVAYVGTSIDEGLYLFLNPNGWAAQEIMRLYTTDILIQSSHCASFQKNTVQIKLEIMRERIVAYLSTFVKTLGGLLQVEKNEVDVNTPNTLMTHEEEILGIHYYSFKKYNDYWFERDKITDNERNDFLMEKWYDENNSSCTIHLIDKFYYDISDSLICNLDIIKDIISVAMGETLDTTFDSFYAVLSNIFSKHKMLLIPTPSNIKNWKVGGLKEIFTPVPFTDINWAEVSGGMSIVGIYVGEAATGPTLYEDDEADKTYNIMMVKSGDDKYRRKIPAPLNNAPQGSVVIPVFAVTYGKQNQQYFQVADLSNTTPQVTDQSIRAQVRIAERAKGDSNIDVATGQDLYDIYSAHAYQATIEMMGCAQIQPMMYFQLNNVYLFTGSYMIFKIEHDITPGKMKTKFTGIKQTWTRTPLLTEPYMMGSMLNDDITPREPIFPPGCESSAKTPSGLRFNNPLNIRYNENTKWDGKVKGGGVTRNGAFEAFCKIEQGYRAAFVLLANYSRDHQRDTIDKIINRWCPPNDSTAPGGVQDTSGYVNNVQNWTNIDKDISLTMTAGDKYIRIATAMSYQENGVLPVVTDIIEGFKLQSRITTTLDDAGKKAQADDVVTRIRNKTQYLTPTPTT
jgi:hypothetical protein